MTFLVAVGVLCALCGVLALLLVVADSYLNDYGICRISINDDERSLEVRGGDTVLSTLSSEKIFIPSACGGRGSCGLCKLKVTAGGGPLLPTETPHLTPAEQADGVRLCCQVKVRSDVAVEIPSELFSIQQYKARVVAMSDLTHDIKFIRFELIDPETIAFVPGQYIQLETPAYSRSPEPVYRAYSLASAPQDPRHVELLIRLVPNGICTTWVFEHLKEGDEVTLNGPYGDFRLQETDAEMVFIAGGSGMAPFRSILLDMEHRQDARRCRYFFGAVRQRDMFYLDEMAHFQQALADFEFVPALSAPEEGQAWDGETGLITEVVGRHYPDCSGVEAYLCGSPGMIDACIGVLTERGLTDDRIHYDKFA